MLKWVAKKFFGAEIDSDLRGLNSLPAMIRLDAAVKVLARVGQGIDALDSGQSLLNVQREFKQARRAAVLQASGYADPVHLIGSLPEHIFVALSDSNSASEFANVCRTIFAAIKKIVEEEGPALFDKQVAQEVLAMTTGFERRLLQRRTL